VGPTIRHASRRPSRALLIRPQRIWLDLFLTLALLIMIGQGRDYVIWPRAYQKSSPKRGKVDIVCGTSRRQDRNLLQSSISSVQHAATLVSNFVRAQVPA
jgi:hypothetical protein